MTCKYEGKVALVEVCHVFQTNDSRPHCHHHHHHHHQHPQTQTPAMFPFHPLEIIRLVIVTLMIPTSIIWIVRLPFATDSKKSDGNKESLRTNPMIGDCFIRIMEQ